jgi:hypothetical protein
MFYISPVRCPETPEVLRQTHPLPEFVGTKSGNYVVETDGTVKRVK